MTSLCLIGDLFFIPSYHRLDSVIALAKFDQKHDPQEKILSKNSEKKIKGKDKLNLSWGNRFVIPMICCFDIGTVNNWPKPEKHKECRSGVSRKVDICQEV